MTIDDANGRGKGMYTAHDKERRHKQESRQLNRSSFEVDKGRIIHSGSLRRLQGKTQVLGVGERDFYRTRLTHSLEVAQIGRGMCIEQATDFCPDQDLVETIALAHDIGHPAFGHFGEEVLHKAMLSHGGFGANPQNIRIVAFLEAKYPKGGLDLTRATLDGLVKYPDLFDPERHSKKPKFTYEDDKDLLKWIKEGVRNPSYKPIEGAIADWADQVAYCVNDIEDALRAGLLNFVEMRIRADEISRAAKDDVGVEHDDDSITGPEPIRERSKILQRSLVEPTRLRERKINLKQWTSESINDLMHDVKIVRTNPEETSVRYQYTLTKSSKARSTAALLKAICRVLVFNDPRVNTLEYKGGRILLSLFHAFRRNTGLLPLDFQELIADGHKKERIVADFVSGMTDRYAYSYYNRLFQPGLGSFYEDV